MRHHRGIHRASRSVHLRFILDLIWRLLLQYRITTSSPLVLGCDFTRLILKAHAPIRRWRDDLGILNLGIYKVEPNTTFACSARLSTVLTVWKPLVALQMPLSTSQAARSNPFRLGRGSLSSFVVGWRSRGIILSNGHRIVDDRFVSFGGFGDFGRRF